MMKNISEQRSRSALLLVPVLLALSALPGCVITPPPSRAEPMYRPAYPAMPEVSAAAAGAIAPVEVSWSLFEDSTASRIGDIITIVLEERTSSSKSAETKITKDTDNTLPNPTVFGNVIIGSNDDDFQDIHGKTDFEGAGESDQSNRLSGTITAVVADVLPNGVLLVQGEKWMNFNRGEEYLRVSGLVRKEDIGPNNTVSSLRLADARLAYSGTGEVAQSNSAGWLTRFFLHPIYPF
jgi:flagellar L-ring protein FlgH